MQPSSQTSPESSHTHVTPPKSISSWAASKHISRAPELSLLHTPQVVKVKKPAHAPHTLPVHTHTLYTVPVYTHSIYSPRIHTLYTHSPYTHTVHIPCTITLNTHTFNRRAKHILCIYTHIHVYANKYLYTCMLCTHTTHIFVTSIYKDVYFNICT